MKFRILIFTISVLYVTQVFTSGSFAVDYSRSGASVGTPSAQVNDYIGMTLQSALQDSNSQVPHSGGGFTLTSARDSDFQLDSFLGYRSISTSEGAAPSLSVFDLMVGGAYFPRSPVFDIFGISPRLKASLLAGVGLSNQTTIFSACLSMNLFFSAGDDPSGMTIGFAYWPSTATNGITTRNASCFSVGFMLAQSNSFL